MPLDLFQNETNQTRRQPLDLFTNQAAMTEIIPASPPAGPGVNVSPQNQGNAYAPESRRPPVDLFPGDTGAMGSIATDNVPGGPMAPIGERFEPPSVTEGREPFPGNANVPADAREEKEPSFLQKADRAAGKVLNGVMFYSGLEGLARLWDVPANVLYGVWEGGKKAIAGDGAKEALTEPVRAAVSTLKGEPYYDMEQAGLPIPKDKTARYAAEVLWQFAKNPLNYIMPYKQYRAIKTTPPKISAADAAPPKPTPKGKLKERPLFFRRGKNHVSETPDTAKRAPEGVNISKAEYDDPGQLTVKRVNEKYRDIVDLDESSAPDEIYQGIVDRTLSRDELDNFLSSTENKPAAVKDVKAAVADNIGDLIETHRYESTAEGKAIEAYLDDMLDVTRKHEGDVSTNRVPDPRAGAEASIPEARELPGDRRVARQAEAPIDEPRTPSQNNKLTAVEKAESSTSDSIAAKANEAATSPVNDLPEPTDAQLHAGNYRKGHVALDGLDISIENPDGSIRSGMSKEGKKWSTKMSGHYGYIKGTVGKDKDHLDVFIKKNYGEDSPVFVVDQVDPVTGAFDEHKILLGYDNLLQAKKGYNVNYEKGWKGLGDITEMTREDFKAWLKSGKTKKPVSPSMSVNPELIFDNTTSIKKTIENLEEAGPVRGFKEKIKRTGEGLSEALHSPEVVYSRDPKIGTEIYQTIDHADQAKNAFLATEGESLVEAAGKIKQGSAASIRVGQALDGKLQRRQLFQNERKLYDFMKGKYDFFLQKYARSVSDSNEGYIKVLRASTSKHDPRVKVSSLPAEAAEEYGVLKNQLAEIRNGRALRFLNKEESKRYWDTRKQMSGILTKEWKETLTTGERKAYDILTRKVKDYLPHIFDQDELIGQFKNEAARIRKSLETATDKGAITQYKTRLKELNEAITNLQGGKMVTYEALPTNVKMRFFETRKGKAGYSFDSVKAFQTYLNSVARKIYDEPAVRKVAELHKDLDPSLKAYNKWYIRRYMGYDKSKLDNLAGSISSFEWMRTLGLNPRSAITNLTQRVNTVAEIGLKHSLKGEKMAFTKEGTRLFNETGIAKEVPQVLLEGPVPEGMEKARAIVGFMFNKMELGNRKHAFLSAYSKFKDAGMGEKEAIRFAINKVHKTQFRYGSVGMPKALTTPAGRVAGQFWSYPIKQCELLARWAKEDPGKLVKYLAMAEGGNMTLKEFADIDLSNALGIGLNYGEAIKALQDIPKNDWRAFWRHARLTVSSGGGLLPSGFGPAVSGAGKVAAAIKEGKGWNQFVKEITPVQAKRFSQGFKALKNRKETLYPIYTDKGYISHYVTKKELVMRSFGPRPATETKGYKKWRESNLLEEERISILSDITKAIIDGDQVKANKLINKYNIVPSEARIKNEIAKRESSYDERKEARKPRAAEIWAQRRENGTD